MENLENLENLESKNNLSYLKEKRDDELQRFNDLIECGENYKRIDDCYNSLLRKQKHLRLAEDAMIIHTLTKHNKI